MSAECLRIVAERDLDLVAEAKAFARSYAPGVRSTDPTCVASAFALHLSKATPRTKAEAA